MSSLASILFKSATKSVWDDSSLVVISNKEHEYPVDVMLVESSGQSVKVEGIIADEYTHNELFVKVDQIFDHQFPLCDVQEKHCKDLVESMRGLRYSYRPEMMTVFITEELNPMLEQRKSWT